MPPLRVTMHLEIVGEPIRGLWCDACALPSALEVIVLRGLSTGSGPVTMAPATIRYCTDCGEGAMSK